MAAIVIVCAYFYLEKTRYTLPDDPNDHDHDNMKPTEEEPLLANQRNGRSDTNPSDHREQTQGQKSTKGYHSSYHRILDHGSSHNLFRQLLPAVPVDVPTEAST